MTYFEFLFRFLVIPIILLLSIHLWDRRKNKTSTDSGGEKATWFAIAVHIGLALVYTTPWDNYLVAAGVWYYNPALVTGLVLGYVPLEEYTFFVLETLLVGLWWWFLTKRITPPNHFSPSPNVRRRSSVALSILWLISIIVFFSNWEPGTYLSITLSWALPPMIAQCAFGADILWQHRKLIVATILPVGLYFSFADSLAITATTWTINPSQSTGLFIGRLPIEEGIFFFITAILLAFGMMLLKAAQSQERLISLFHRSPDRGQEDFKT